MNIAKLLLWLPLLLAGCAHPAENVARIPHILSVIHAPVNVLGSNEVRFFPDNEAIRMIKSTERGTDETGTHQTNAAPPLQDPLAEKIRSDLLVVFRRYYPAVTSHVLKNEIRFEDNTRVFIVHEPLMTGEWQDPWEERGPKRGGILCDIVLEPGPYRGQAMIPQTFDKRYFKTLLLAPNLTNHNCNAQVLLSYPSNVSTNFLKEFTVAVNALPKRVD